MEKNLSTFNTSNLVNEDNNIISKLRRLRIQEALLLQSVQKPNKNKDVDLCSSSYKLLLNKVKDSYKNIKSLYDDVKANTQSQELLAELDIDEMKKNIFELETNIKTFKADIHTELTALKLSEQDLNRQILENPNEVDNIKHRPKTHSVNYNAIVPSPVRVMMTSPFKCTEVQQFQEFMKSSPNRCGGWNEFNHNLFVKYWQKFFGKSYSSVFEDETFQQSLPYEMFVEDLKPKLQGMVLEGIGTKGVTAALIALHAKWYVKYLFFKEKQQNAIDKWKWNKMTARKVSKKVMYADEEDSYPLETSSDVHGFIACNFDSSHGTPEERSLKTSKILTKSKIRSRKAHLPHSILKPTKQWLNRYNDVDGDIKSSRFNSIECMEKQLHTPFWRHGL